MQLPGRLQAETGAVADEDGAAAFLSELLDALAEVDRFANGGELTPHDGLSVIALEDGAKAADQGVAGVNANADGERRLVLLDELVVEIAQPIQHFARTGNGEVGMIGLRM